MAGLIVEKRLKGAFDSIADLAEEPPRARPARASSQSKLTARTHSPRKGPRPRTPDTSDKTPDPDPSTFALDAPAAEDGSKTKSEDEEVSRQEASAAVVYANRADGEETLVSKAEDVGEPQHKTEERSAELGEDTKAKLRRLDKLESKYQELLKAYRKAHARNAAIVPFEASLRENTPLTSISDPGALVEYVSQLNLKGDMVMDELKRVSGEKDMLKLKLDEAKQQTKAALDEVTQLRTEKEELLQRQELSSATVLATQKTTDQGLVAYQESEPEEPLEEQQKSTADAVSVTDASSLTKSEHDEELAKTMNLELSSLKTEVEEKTRIITVLEAENNALIGNLTTANSMVEGLRQDLDVAENKLKDLESSVASHSQVDNDARERYHAVEAEASNLREQVRDAEATVESKKEEIQHLQMELSTIKSLVATRETLSNSSTVEAAPANSNVTPSQREMDEDHDEASGPAKKKKNKKKKKKGPAAGNEDIATPPSVDMISAATTPTNVSSQALYTHANELKQRDTVIENLQSKLKVQDDLQEEINDLRDELIILGQEHVTAKDHVASLRKENSGLKSEMEKLETQIDSAQKGAASDRQKLIAELTDWKTKSNALQSESESQIMRLQTLEANIADHEAIKASVEAVLEESRRTWSSEIEEYKVKTKGLETDVIAAQQLAASRYKDLVQAKETLQKLHPEIVSLRSEVTELRTTKTELETTNSKVRRLEARESALQTEIGSSKRKVADADAEVEKLKREASRFLALEESSRQLQTDLQRVSNERAEIVAARDDLAEDLQKTQGELRESRAKVRQFDSQIAEAQKEATVLQQHIAKQMAQLGDAVRDMSLARDQAAEMAIQMREAKERCDNLEEELTDAHRLMNERAREGETMRRLLGDVENRAESRVKELKERTDILIQERDRAEDEASTMGRRRTRELEDLKNRLRDLERELKHASDDKFDTERNRKDLLRQLDENGQKVTQAMQELSDTRSAMDELRTALDDSERHYRDSEAEKTELKRSLDDSQSRLEKAQRLQKVSSCQRPGICTVFKANVVGRNG